MHRPLVARPGDTLAFGARPASGARAYLAVHGGYALPLVMGSETTYLRSGFGGFQGRALARGDVLPLHAPLDVGRDLAALQEALWQIRVYLPATLAGKRRDTIRFLPGRHWHEFSDASRAAFAGQAFRISPQSDRMGYRLQGPRWPWRNRARRCRKRPASAPCRCHPAAKPSSSWPTGRPPAATQDRADRLGGPARAGAIAARPGAAFPADRAGRGAAPGRRARARLRPAAGRAGADARAALTRSTPPGATPPGPGRPL